MSLRIKALDASVVNKIAAGEIIISPVNALKEMMENSIDANATMIDILVKEGGIKVLQITDNGSGINKSDLPILCERFTTSKLQKFEDLSQIQTYGFRGEALASISHVARVTVTTKVKEDRCAWRVSYAEGKMLETPKPVAGKDGTTILVEDLFFNIPSRLRALRSHNDEYSKILDVVGRYAIHSKGIGFSCKKFGDSNYSLAVKPSYIVQDRIRTVFNKSVASNLISFHISKVEDLNLESVDGKVCNLNFISKKSISPIFFINNRLVTCDPLRRALNSVYSNYLPKGNRPFIYLGIIIDSAAVDVNVHPTKREVRFLSQDEIIEKIANQLHAELSAIDTSRTFKASSISTSQPGSLISSNNTIENGEERKTLRQAQVVENSYAITNNQLGRAKRQENKLVRTDASQAKITSFLSSSQQFNFNGSSMRRQLSQSKLKSVSRSQEREQLTLKESEQLRDANSSSDNELKDQPRKRQKLGDYKIPCIIDGEKNTLPVSKDGYTRVPKERVNVNLTSIKKMREKVDDSIHRELTDIFANLNYVGVVDEERRLAAIQHDLKLFLIDYGSVCYELFYQIGLTDFANFGKINLQSTDVSDDIVLYNLLSEFEELNDDTSKEKIISKIWDMSSMLDEYFSIELVNDSPDNDLKSVKLKSLPLLLKGYIPSLTKLPFFIYRLGKEVNWGDEQECLDSILREIALLYIPDMVPKVDTSDMSLSEDEKTQFIDRKEHISSLLEHVLFPCIKRRFLAPRHILKDVVEIANLPGLYKVFERC
ncbi:mismatch repair ATPase MLH1 [Saccharomyces paradoxus]|uniref:Mismatch repair ATPase MLH1 n=1 Tax=Saccharomyces paradoxus TaxID=27291 RepID=A0A8B8UXH1_SACPA|nr:Mlh1 [Saccharomyces paradoxus]QHS75437.1 Mlh1 [Saccharomyces paradoxus]